MAQMRVTRRRRLREAAYEELVDAARGLLREGEAVSLRAVAGRMQIAPSALYRYVSSLEELQRLVADRVCVEILEVARRAGESYEDPVACSVAGMCAFRRWALSRRPEAELVFASGRGGLGLGSLGPQDLRHLPGFVAFLGYFMELVTRARASGAMRQAPPMTDLSPRARAALTAYQQEWGAVEDEALPEMPLEAWWVQYVAWARLVGVIVLEVTDQVPQPLVASGALFEEALIDFLERYVGPPDADLTAVIDSNLGPQP